MRPTVLMIGAPIAVPMADLRVWLRMAVTSARTSALPVVVLTTTRLGRIEPGQPGLLRLGVRQAVGVRVAVGSILGRGDVQLSQRVHVAQAGQHVGQRVDLSLGGVQARQAAAAHRRAVPAATALSKGTSTVSGMPWQRLQP